jgi:uncharacterized protein (TIGR02453 family)
MPMAQTAYFTPASFQFLRDLARHNDKEWFARHKPQYEERVRGPALRLIADLAAPLAGISPHLVANPRPVGGSLFRIHRDTRFSKDKSPYKTHVGMSFYHAATKATARGDAGNAAPGRLDAPGFYLHVQPGESFIGGGLWHPQPQTVQRVRQYMLNNPASWKKATRARPFTPHYALDGDSLVRPPPGYDPQHELIVDIKRKDFVATSRLTEAELCAPGLVRRVTARYAALASMIDWLCGALDLEF